MPPSPRAVALNPQPLPPRVAANLATEVETKLRKRFGLAAADATPAALKTLINKEIAAAAPALKGKVTAEVEGAIAGVGQARTIERFKENLGFAKNGLSAISAASEVTDILKQRAELLFKKKTALVTAGFSAAEAMEILLADIASKAH